MLFVREMIIVVIVGTKKVRLIWRYDNLKYKVCHVMSCDVVRIKLKCYIESDLIPFALLLHPPSLIASRIDVQCVVHIQCHRRDRRYLRHRHHAYHCGTSAKWNKTI
jgi:hypothetical protein